jgi:hypothetical protein
MQQTNCEIMGAKDLIVQMQIQIQNLQTYKENRTEIDTNATSRIAHL